jgi:hypothetical protein
LIIPSLEVEPKTLFWNVTSAFPLDNANWYPPSTLHPSNVNPLTFSAKVITPLNTASSLRVSFPLTPKFGP